MGLAAAACAKQSASTAGPDVLPSASASASENENANASASTVAAPSPPPPSVQVVPRPPPRMGMCPSGKFCVAQPHRVGADAGAPSPYGMCAASVAMPGDAGVFGMTTPNVYFDATGTKDARAKDPKTCCYTWVIPCPGGRALRDEDGRSVVAKAAPRRDWLDAAVREAASCREDERELMARRWEREGAFEHASIASFARATLDLLALGAPADLVARAQLAGLDEIEHARVAYALASAFSGRDVGPGPLPLATRGAPTLESVVREAIAEGCVGEAAAALALREEAAERGGACGALLERIAEDEERHAALAYATVAWAASLDPDAVTRVVDEELVRDVAPSHARALREIAAPCLRALISSRSALRS